MRKGCCVAVMLTVALGIVAYNGSYSKGQEISQGEKVLKKPVYTAKTDSTEWLRVSFGEYPQTEVTEEGLLAELDALEDTEYSSLGDVEFQGEKYRRLSEDTALNTDSAEGYYDWSVGGSEKGYHYFRFEPIIWRVLDFDSEGMILLADTCLEDKKFHNVDAEVGWQDSSLRSWLNGYTGEENAGNYNYSKGNAFIDIAFTKEEQTQLLEYEAANPVNPYYETGGSEATCDKVFLLNVEDVRKEAYGFCKKVKATNTRVMKCSDYAWARGLFANVTEENRTVWWWLRTQGKEENEVTGVLPDGYMLYHVSEAVDSVENGVCPVIYLSEGADWKLAEESTGKEEGQNTPVPRTPSPTGNTSVAQGTPEPQQGIEEPEPSVSPEPSPTPQPVTELGKPQKLHVTYKGKVKALADWKKVSGADKYRIKIITGEHHKKKVKKILVSKSQYLLTHCKKGKKYCIQVCAGRKEEGKMVWGPYSNKVRYCHQRKN